MAMDTTSGLPAGEEVTISQAGPAGGGDAPVHAELDVLIERPDLGEGCYTVVAAGSRIPPQLLGLPRGPYRPSVTLDGPKRRQR